MAKQKKGSKKKSSKRKKAKSPDVHYTFQMMWDPAEGDYRPVKTTEPVKKTLLQKLKAKLKKLVARTRK